MVDYFENNRVAFAAIFAAFAHIGMCVAALA